MIRRKREFKKLVIVSILTLTILLTGIQIFSMINVNFGHEREQIDIEDLGDGLEINAIPYLSDYYINGSGVDHDVRIYASNESNTLNNLNYFEIPALSTSDVSYLSSGAFNFTFQKNYTTEYVLEDDDPLNARDFIYYDFDPDLSSMELNTGSNLTRMDFQYLNDDNDIIIDAVNGVINYTIAANFTGTSFHSTAPPININFDRELILGLFVSVTQELSKDAYMTLKMFDRHDSSWKNITTRLFINSSIGVQTHAEEIVNQNLNFIDFSDTSHVQFYFHRSTTDEYNVTISNFIFNSTLGFDLPITSQDQVALEYDLKGLDSSVHGFYAWIRTVNLTLALNSELNITLYEANSTIRRTGANLGSNTIRPDYSKPIDSFIVDYNMYHGDGVAYFEFDLGNTADLTLNNYFIVIKSNRTEEVYRIATLPRSTFGDPNSRIDHQLKKSEDSGSTWENARKLIDPFSGYRSEQLDASPFWINVTRGYMPSDFKMSDDDQLTIQDLPIVNLVIDYYPYNESSYLTWGLGQWNHDFPTEIVSDAFFNYRIDLNWNTSSIKGFLFNVSYFAEAYWIENAPSFYNVSYGTTPIWNIDFNLNLNDPNLDTWNFYEFWYLFPSYYTAHNLTNPSGSDVYNETSGELPLEDQAQIKKIIVNDTVVSGLSGNYILNLTSTNLIHEMQSFINFNGNLWETNGFMYGDNISVALKIQDQAGFAGKGGSSNVTLFYPDNSTRYPGANLFSDVGVRIKDVLIFRFNNDTILDVSEDIPLLGEYYLGYFWTNGSALGCKALRIFIDTYRISIDDFYYNPDLDQNILEGLVTKVNDDVSYSLLVGSVNETTGTYDPNFYSINVSEIDQQFSYTSLGQEFPILMKTFLQNESILNPDETVEFKVLVQNLHEFLSVDVKINVKLVSVANEEWIIDETTSSVESLELRGTPGNQDEHEFSVSLQLPTLQPDGVWQGLNAPLRKGGVKTIVTFFINDNDVGDYNSDNLALLINSTESEFEGHVIALRHSQGITGPSILTPFNREDSIYLPDESTFIINVYDENLLSSYSHFIESFTLKTNSRFTNVTSVPETPIFGKTFNLSTTLETEFGVELSGKNVTLQYLNGEVWENFSSQISDVHGFMTFEINTLDLNRENQFTFKLLWGGDNYVLNNSELVTITAYKELNEISIVLEQVDLQIFRFSNAIIRARLRNTGNSSLFISNTGITVSINPSLESTIVGGNSLELQDLRPGEVTELTIQITVPFVNQITVNLTIEAKNLLTDEILTTSQSDTFQVYDKPITEYLIQYFILIILGIIIVIWFLSILYARRVKRKIETPIEEPVKKRPRKGRYVKVSDVERRPKEPSDEEKKEATDLDSLLEEKGLDGNNDS